MAPLVAVAMMPPKVTNVEGKGNIMETAGPRAPLAEQLVVRAAPGMPSFLPRASCSRRVLPSASVPRRRVLELKIFFIRNSILLGSNKG
mgnify:CR=1 FL=1